MGAAWVIITVAAGIAAYWISLVLSPYRDCRRCHGRGSLSNRAFTGARGRCRICWGTGDRIRWGVMLFRRKTYRAIKGSRTRRDYW